MSVYAIVWAYEQDISNSGAKFTLVTAAQYCNDQGICWVSQNTLAEDMSMGVRTVRDHLTSLERAGLIERVERRRKDGTRTSDLIKLLGFSKRQKSPVEPPSTGEILQVKRQNSPGKKRHKEETSVNNSSKDEEAGASPGTFVGYLREELDGADVPLLRNREDRYAGEFNKLIKKGVADDVLYKACDRIVERWRGDEHRKLLVEQALEDVVNGKPPKHVSKLPTSRASDVNHNGKTRAEREADRRRQMQQVGLVEEDVDTKDLDAKLKELRAS